MIRMKKIRLRRRHPLTHAVRPEDIYITKINLLINPK